MIHLRDVKQEGGDAWLAARAEICFFLLEYILTERETERDRERSYSSALLHFPRGYDGLSQTQSAPDRTGV